MDRNLMQKKIFDQTRTKIHFCRLEVTIDLIIVVRDSGT